MLECGSARRLEADKMMTSSSPYGAFLAYNPNKNADGLGAQMQRILGIFGLSRALGVGYAHTGLSRIETNPGDPNSSEGDRQLLLARANELVSLPSDLSTRAWKSPGIGRVGWPEAARILHAHKVARRLRQRIVIPLSTPYPWADRHPNVYRAAAEIVSNRIRPRGLGGGRLRVDVHIRRALAPADENLLLSQRFVPTEWYQRVLESVVEGFESEGAQFEIRIHTDIPSGEWQGVSGLSSGTRALLESDGLLNSEGLLIQHWQGLEASFAALPNVQVCREWDPIEVLRSMASADLLVTCASSLSFVGGLLRNKRPVISPEFWHAGPSSWLVLPRKLGSGEREKIVGVVGALTKTGISS
jgi:hypothetical protein